MQNSVLHLYDITFDTYSQRDDLNLNDIIILIQRNKIYFESKNESRVYLPFLRLQWWKSRGVKSSDPVGQFQGLWEPIQRPSNVNVNCLCIAQVECVEGPSRRADTKCPLLCYMEVALSENHLLTLLGFQGIYLHFNFHRTRDIPIYNP